MAGQYDGWREYEGPVRVSHEASIVPPKKRNKYSARPHTALPDLRVLPTDECAAVPGGIRFDSKKEAMRFVELFALKESGAIRDLELQPGFHLYVERSDGVKVSIGRYVADFGYTRDGSRVIEDAKGVRTAVYLWKKKHVEAQYGITVVEV